MLSSNVDSDRCGNVVTFMDRRANNPRDLASIARGQRQRRKLTQTQVAHEVGVSRQWLSEFESGKPTAELGLVLRVLDYLGLEMIVSERAKRPEGRSPELDLDDLLARHRKR